MIPDKFVAAVASYSRANHKKTLCGCSWRGPYLGKQSPAARWLLSIMTVIISANLLGTCREAQATRLAIRGPNDQLANDVVAIKEGADLDLSCPIVMPSEDMIISWTCDNELANIRSSRIHVTEVGKLRIRSAKIGDSCNYRCEAADGFGTLSVIIKVIIVDKKLVDQLSRSSQNHTTTLTTTAIASTHRQATTKQPTNNNQAAPAPAPAPTTKPTTHLAADLNSMNTSFVDTHNSTTSSLDVEIEPSLVRIEKNRTFSLECRVKMGQQQEEQQPQIIWLKEFVGNKPDSLSEAHDKNLVSIDNVYYHSLNWPRSITQSNKSSTTNSALLVRQSNLVHSGKYICFAGYPPYTMSSRLTSDNGPGLQASAPKLKYKLATAEVQVDDNQEGENNQSNINRGVATSTSGSTESGGSPLVDRRQRYLLVSVVSNNTWMRNLTIILIVFCGLLYTVKSFYVKYRTRKTSKQSDGTEAGRQQQQQVIKSLQRGQASENMVVSSPSPSQLATTTTTIEQPSSNNTPPLSSMQSTSVPNIIQPSSPSAKLANVPDSLHLLKQFQPLAKIPSGITGCSMMIDDNEHLYSEINDRFMMKNNNSEQEYYKVPVKRSN